MSAGPCSLCNLTLWEVDYEDDDVVLAEARDKKKHALRYMVTSREHTTNPPRSTRWKALGILMEIAQGTSFHSGILLGTHASIPDHWHLVLCDLVSGEDRALIDRTYRWEIDYKVPS